MAVQAKSKELNNNTPDWFKDWHRDHFDKVCFKVEFMMKLGVPLIFSFIGLVVALIIEILRS